MRIRTTILLIAILLSVLAVPSSAEVRVSVGPVVRYNMGQTEYIFEAFLDATSTIKSQLEFPLSVPMIGGRIDVDVVANKRLDMLISASVLIDAKDPTGTMLDRDWINNFEFSHTDSEVRMWSMFVDLEMAKWVYGSKSMSVYIVGGLKGQRISQDFIGLWGWQDFDGRIDFEFPPIPVGLYEISYAMPHVGIMPRWTMGQTSLDFKLALALVVISDQDHHLLRNFTAESSGTGRGVIARGRYRYDFPGAKRQGNAFLEFSGDILMATAELSETMTWYGDDAASPDYDDTGDIITGVPHEVNTTQFGFGLFFGYKF